MAEFTILVKDIKTQHFAIGDKLLEVSYSSISPEEYSVMELPYGDFLEEAARISGYDVQTLRDWRTVAERIPPSLRNENPELSWSQWVAISRLKRHDKESTRQAIEELISHTKPNTTVIELRKTVQAMSSGPNREFTIKVDSMMVDFLLQNQYARDIKNVGEVLQNTITCQLCAWYNHAANESTAFQPNIFEVWAREAKEDEAQAKVLAELQAAFPHFEDDEVVSGVTEVSSSEPLTSVCC